MEQPGFISQPESIVNYLVVKLTKTKPRLNSLKFGNSNARYEIMSGLLKINRLFGFIDSLIEVTSLYNQMKYSKNPTFGFPSIRIGLFWITQ
jgi:hypothetical protein